MIRVSCRLRLLTQPRFQNFSFVIIRNCSTTPRFAELDGLSAASLKAIDDLGFSRCTPVQHQTLPVLLRGSDMLAKAHTGTGKTVGFLLPTIERLAA